MTIFLPDISSYQTGFPLTGIPAVIVKATEATGYVNPDYARVASQAKARGLPWVAYHYLHAGSVTAQASLFRSVAGNAPAMIDVESVAVALAVRAVVDAHPELGTRDHVHVEAAVRRALRVHGIEQAGSRLAVHLNHPPVAAVAREALHAALSFASPSLADVLGFASALRSQGGICHLVYLPRWYWQALGTPDLTPLTRAGLHLISSNYTTYSDTGPGWAAYGGVAPVIWQFTDAQPLNGYDVDMNAYRGSVDELRALVMGDDTMGVWDTEPGSSIAFTLLNGAIGGPQHVRDAVLKRAVDAGFAAVQTALTGERAAIDALSKALAAGGGSVDAAAVNAHIDAKVADVVTAVADLHDDLAAARARIEELEAALRAGADATSHALDAVPSPPPAPPAG